MDDQETIERVGVLDHGYVKIVESWGSDQRIVEAARMSTGKGFLGWGSHKVVPGDEKLLRYLYEHAHATPFEFAGMVIEVQAPIFVFREWHRHRTQSYNEASSRYEPLPDLNYVPTVERLMLGGGHLTKQAGTVKDAAALTDEMGHDFIRRLRGLYEESQLLYEDALSDGIPKELARIILPVGRYSRMRASANLRNWLAFLTLRQAPYAQWEIRQYADVVGSFIATAFPRTWELFQEKAR
jgi:thymidylate synthase (FAD)